MVSISEGINKDRFACLLKLTDMVESEQNLFFLGGCFKCQPLYIHLNRTFSGLTGHLIAFLLGTNFRKFENSLYCIRNQQKVTR